MRTVAFVQARQGSSRLPGKTLMPLAGRPMLAHVLERAAAVRGVSTVVLVTSVNARDTPVADLALAMGMPVVRGDEQDVLGRFAFAASELGLSLSDHVMRVTGDCPLLCVDVCERVVQEALRDGWFDVTTNDTTRSGYPDGTDCEVVTVRGLVLAASRAVTARDREHVTPWMRRNLATRTIQCPVVESDYADAKWSVDCADDLERVRAIYGYLSGAGAYTLPGVTRAWRRAQQAGR